MIGTALDDFYLTAEQLQQSPSSQDGVTSNLESQLRRYGCDIISEAVVLLSLPQGVACTAQVLLHRFYCKRSLSQFDVKVMAMAVFWLAAKLEEVIEIDSDSKLKLRDILCVFYRIIRRRDEKSLEPLDPYSNQYVALKEQVVSGERHALRAFGFIVHVEHPHRFVLTFGQLLGLGREVLQEGWNMANDSLRAPLCVRYRAEVVACGVLFLAARRKGVAMPEDPPWWELFSVSVEQLGDVCTALLDLYKCPRARYSALGRDYTSRGVGDRASPIASLPVAAEKSIPTPMLVSRRGELSAERPAPPGQQHTHSQSTEQPCHSPIGDDAGKERRGRNHSGQDESRSRSRDQRDRERRRNRSRSPRRGDRRRSGSHRRRSRSRERQSRR